MGPKIAATALRVSITYAILAGIWIALSDRAVAFFVTDPQRNLSLQTYKGWVFVLVTAFLLFVTLHNRLRKWDRESRGRQEAEVR